MNNMTENNKRKMTRQKENWEADQGEQNEDLFDHDTDEMMTKKKTRKKEEKNIKNNTMQIDHEAEGWWWVTWIKSDANHSVLARILLAIQLHNFDMREGDVMNTEKRLYRAVARQAESAIWTTARPKMPEPYPKKRQH